MAAEDRRRRTSKLTSLTGLVVRGAPHRSPEAMGTERLENPHNSFAINGKLLHPPAGVRWSGWSNLLHALHITPRIPWSGNAHFQMDLGPFSIHSITFAYRIRDLLEASTAHFAYQA